LKTPERRPRTGRARESLLDNLAKSEENAGSAAISGSVAYNVRRLREENDLSQDQLAEALEAAGLLRWGQGTVRDVELARRALRLEELIVLALFFQVPIEDILMPPASMPTVLNRGVTVEHTALLRVLRGEVPPRALRKDRTIHQLRSQKLQRTPRLEKELREWEAEGGDAGELMEARTRLARGEITQQSYAAWKRHASARNRRRT
jgi:transcriptional regulator with XRE-family HTH domain